MLNYGNSVVVKIMIKQDSESPIWAGSCTCSMLSIAQLSLRTAAVSSTCAMEGV